MGLTAIVLAAGKGTRMKSELPKVLHLVAGRPMLAWVVDATDGAIPTHTAVVVGHGREQVSAALAEHFPNRTFVEAFQRSQKGTGDAAAVGLAALDVADGGYDDDDDVLVLPGDTPLLSAEMIETLIRDHRESGAACTLVTTRLENPFGYGRVQRNRSGGIESIVEERDCTDAQREMNEVNAGMYCFRRSLLAPALRMISTDNVQGELYLTDVIGVLAGSGHPVQPFVADHVEISGVNDRAQLAAAEAVVRTRILARHQAAGVHVQLPSSTVIDADVAIGANAAILAGSVLQGETVVGESAIVGPNSHLVDAEVGAGARVYSSVVVNSAVPAGAEIGPFATVESGTVGSAGTESAAFEQEGDS